MDYNAQSHKSTSASHCPRQPGKVPCALGYGIYRNAQKKHNGRQWLGCLVRGFEPWSPTLTVIIIEGPKDEKSYRTYCICERVEFGLPGRRAVDRRENPTHTPSTLSLNSGIWNKSQECINPIVLVPYATKKRVFVRCPIMPGLWEAPFLAQDIYQYRRSTSHLLLTCTHPTTEFPTRVVELRPESWQRQGSVEL
jgi:hypothetical protein